jgi:hypothetical protein
MSSIKGETPEGKLRGTGTKTHNTTSAEHTTEALTNSQRADVIRENPSYQAHLAGWFSGFNEATAIYAAQIAQLESDCDRYYRLAFGSRPQLQFGTTFADLERNRGNHAHAAEYEARLEARFKARAA